jgi:hypothetical protein
MEPLAHEGVARQFEFKPTGSIQIERPHVVEVSVISFATTDNHVIANKAAGMVSPRARY